jgi:hypothetical protein
MAEGIQTPDGTKLDLAAAEQTFNEAMAAPADDVPAPKRATPEAKEAAKAPRRRSKTATDTKARSASPASQKSDKDFTEELNGLTSVGWLVTASLPPTQAVAAIIKVNQAQLVASLNTAAQSNAAVRGQIEKFSGSGNVALAGLAVVTANMAIQTIQVMRDPDLRGRLAEQTRSDLLEYAKQVGIRPLETGTANADADSNN